MGNVSSGIGRLGNFLAVPHMEKFVLVSPLTHPNPLSLKSDLRKEATTNKAVCKFVLNGSIGNLIRLLAAMAGIDLIKAGFACASVVVAGCAYAWTRTQ